MDTQVFGMSTDFIASLAQFAKETHASFPLLSDHDRKISELYGVLIPQMGIANRATFVIDKDGRIAEIIQGNSAIDPSGAETACSRLRK
jgi:thioredoxin-dependent peroxiredoxin